MNCNGIKSTILYSFFFVFVNSKQCQIEVTRFHREHSLRTVNCVQNLQNVLVSVPKSNVTIFHCYYHVSRSVVFKHCFKHAYSFYLCNNLKIPIMFLRFKQRHSHEMSTNIRYIILLVSAWSTFNGNLIKYSNSAMDLLCIFQRFIPSPFTIHHQVTFSRRCEQTHNRSINYRAAWYSEHQPKTKKLNFYSRTMFIKTNHILHTKMPEFNIQNSFSLNDVKYRIKNKVCT